MPFILGIRPRSTASTEARRRTCASRSIRVGGVWSVSGMSPALCALAACRSLSVSTHGRARKTGLPMQELDLDADHPAVILAMARDGDPGLELVARGSR